MAKRRKPTRPPEPELTPEESFDSFDRDCKSMIASLGRIKDPMLRYIVCMMIDRLTQQILSIASTGPVQRAHALKALDLN